MNRWIALLLAPIAVAGSVHAGKVQTWRQESAKDFQSGKIDRLVVRSEGAIQLSRQLRAIAEVNAAHVWGLTLDNQGNIFAVTGNPGSLVMIGSSGAVTTPYKDAHQQLFAAAVAADGTVYFGVSPGGTILRRKPGGPVETFFATGETYIWSLAIDSGGSIYAATGTHGRLFRISSRGEGTVLFEAKQPHLLCVSTAPSGTVYVGASKEGLVYRINADGRAFVAYDASQTDVHTLLVAEDGTVYAGTGSPDRASAASVRESRGSSEGGGGLRMTPPGVAVGDGDQKPAGVVGPISGGSPSGIGSAPPVPSGRPAASPGENSVYRIKPSGVVDEVFREKALVLSLAIVRDRLLVGTGQEGRLFEVDLAAGAQQELARLESGQINSLVKRPDNTVVLGTGTPGKLYGVEDRFVAKGSLLSEVFDARLQTQWGKSFATVETAKDTSLDIAVRTGNISDPDSTWTDWSDDASRLPVGRFFQYRVTLNSPGGASTPLFRDFTLYYSTVNKPPKVESVETPNFEKTPATNSNEKIKLRWRATDPNSDSLVYTVEAKKEGWPQWIRLAKELTATEYEWDPTSAPGGAYQVRVTASDRPSNREKESLSGEKTSQPFVIDREPPDTKIAESRKVDRRFEVLATATDRRSHLISADYSVDSNPWVPLFPDDGIFDSREEHVTFVTGDMDPGSHLIVVRFRDAAGHWGMADAVVRIDK